MKSKAAQTMPGGVTHDHCRGLRQHAKRTSNIGSAAVSGSSSLARLSQGGQLALVNGFQRLDCASRVCD